MKKIIVLFFLISLSFSVSAQVKILFDASKAETAGSADWVIDEDANNMGWSTGPAVLGGGSDGNAQRYPTPLQSTVTASTAENYWKGGISYWGIDCVKQGYQVESLPYNGLITYGNGSNVQDLSNYKIFVVCEPNIIFTASEKTAILTFVQNGGSLFMISDHNGSDRNNDGYDSPAIWNDFMTNNGIQSNPFGISFDLVSISQTTSNLPSLPGDPLLHGSFGDVTQAQWSAGTTMSLSTASNSSVKGIVYKTGASTTGSTNVMVAYATYGSGKVVAFGDSSPFDDGTGDPGDVLYTGYTGDASGNHRLLIMNATIWLAASSGPVPTVTTTAASSITASTATLNGTVNPNGISTTYDFDWGTTVSYGSMTTATSAGSGSSAVAVSANLSGLAAGTTYHYRLGGTNSNGNGNGTDLQFTTLAALPTVTTTTPTSITTTTASSGGNVTSAGGGIITARGVCWALTSNPDITSSHTNDGSGTGIFSSSVTALSAGSIYHVRAYATNSAGTSYGSDLQFTTAGAPTLAVSPANQSVTAAAGTTSFTVTSNSAWTASSDQGWCTVTASGSGNGTISCSYAQNTTFVTRVANVTVTVSSLTPVIVTVTQDAAPLPDFFYTMENDVQTSANTLEFDLYLRDPSPASSFELASVQAGILVNSAIYGGGTLTAAIVAGTSQFNSSQVPASIAFVQTQNCIKIAPKSPPGAGSGTIISSTGQGTRICRVRLTNTVAFAQAQANLTFNFTTTPYPAKVFQYLAGQNVQLTCTTTNTFSNCANPVLNPPIKAVNLTLLLEGLYAGNGTMNAAKDENGVHWGAFIADKIIVELHNASDFTTLEYFVPNVDLSTDGNATLTIPNIYNGTYYIAVKHRNSITTVSAAPVSFAGSVISYNFTDNAGKAYGNNLLMMVDGKYTIYGGDASEDDLIDGTDMSLVDNDAADFLAGYLVTDINGDGLVDGSDLAVVDNNAAMFISSSQP